MPYGWHCSVGSVGHWLGVSPPHARKSLWAGAGADVDSSLMSYASSKSGSEHVWCTAWGSVSRDIVRRVVVFVLSNASTLSFQ